MGRGASIGGGPLLEEIRYTPSVSVYLANHHYVEEAEDLLKVCFMMYLKYEIYLTSIIKKSYGLTWHESNTTDS